MLITHFRTGWVGIEDVGLGTSMFLCFTFIKRTISGTGTLCFVLSETEIGCGTGA